MFTRDVFATCLHFLALETRLGKAAAHIISSQMNTYGAQFWHYLTQEKLLHLLEIVLDAA